MSAREADPTLPRIFAAAVAVAGIILVLYAIYLARQPLAFVWNGEKAAGEILDLVPAKYADGRIAGYAPVVAYADRNGRRFTFTPPALGYASSYAAGDPVVVYYDRAETSRAALSNFYGFWLAPLLAAGGGGLMLLLAGVIAATARQAKDDGDARPARATTWRLRDQSEVREIQFHPLNPIAYKHYLSFVAGPAGAPKVRIVEAAAAIPQGRPPAVLCELLAYMEVLARSEDAVAFLAAHAPHFENVQSLGPAEGRGLAFVFEETGFIILPSLVPAGPWRWLRHLLSLRTSGRKFVPAETDWDAAGRNRSLAEWWDGVRDGVEAWVNAVALEDDAARPLVLAGHGIGGGLAMLAAYEFKKRGRNVLGVVSFAAPDPGGGNFRREYQQLGLDERTLNVATRAGSPFALSLPLVYVPTGTKWVLDPSASAAAVADRASADAKGLARLALGAMCKEEAGRRPAMRRLLLAALSVLPGPRDAIADCEARTYALLLRGISRARLRELMAPSGDAKAEAAASMAFGDHVAYLCGARPEAPGDPVLGLRGRARSQAANEPA